MSRLSAVPALHWVSGSRSHPATGLAARQQSNPPAPTVDVETLGPKVGEALPEFSLRDQDGHIQSLTSLLGPKGAVIVFFRSADW